MAGPVEDAVPVDPGAPLLATAQRAASKDVEDGQHLCQSPTILGQHNTSANDDHPLGLGLLGSRLPVSAHLCQVVCPGVAALIEGLVLAVAVEACMAQRPTASAAQRMDCTLCTMQS